MNLIQFSMIGFTHGFRSFRESNAVKNAGGNAEVFPSDLKPVESPRHSLSLALNNLNSSEW